jgi:hypothetical protein
MPTRSNARRNAIVAGDAAAVDAGSGAGKLRVYNGAQPAGPDTAVSTQTLLAEFTLNDPAYAAGATGVQNLDVTPVPTATGLAAGTITWYRVLDSANVAVFDGPAAELDMNTLVVSVGLALELTGGSISQTA